MQRQFQFITVGVFLGVMATVIGISISMSGGHLIYYLDDPYIHLAVSENILRGGYGVNLSEYSSPSSSIIYAYIIAGLLVIGAGDAGPLIVGVMSSAAAIWVVSGFIWARALSQSDAALDTSEQVFWAILIGLLSNLWYVTMMGMEHPLHTLVAVLTCVSLVRILETGRVSAVLVALVVLGPLIRFEGLALSIAVVIALILARHVLVAALSFGAMVALLGGYVWYMYSLGLPPLPSSVMVKSNAIVSWVDNQSLARLVGIGVNVLRSLFMATGILFFITMWTVLRHEIWSTKSIRNPRFIVALVVFLTLAGHVTLSSYDRYAVYALFVAMIGVIYLFPAFVISIPKRLFALSRGHFRQSGAVVIVILLVLASNGTSLFKTPFGARNIFQQQYQMHLFSVEFFPRTFAVNDLGWVAYRNDAFVVDLWGLGSERARQLTVNNGRNAASIAQITNEYSATYAMIYEGWFRNAIPDNWCRIATLTTSKISAASSTVSFFLIDHAGKTQMYEALVGFQPTLPHGATLMINNDC